MNDPGSQNISKFNPVVKKKIMRVDRVDSVGGFGLVTKLVYSLV